MIKSRRLHHTILGAAATRFACPSRVIKQILLFLLMFACWPAFAEGSRVAVVYMDESPAVEELVVTMREYLGNDRVHAYSLAKNTLSDAGLYVAVGNRALEFLIQKNVRTPILTVLISQNNFTKLIKQNTSRKTVSAIFSDPDPRFQIKLAEILYQRKVEIGVLLSDSTEYLRDEVKEAASLNNMSLVIENITDNDQINKALSRMSSMEVLLALPDQTIYNPNSIRNILLSTYRNNQSVIGFSKGMVKAGALATVSAGVIEIVEETVAWIREFDIKQEIPKPSFSSTFDVEINKYVARSLEVKSSEKDQILKALRGKRQSYVKD